MLSDFLKKHITSQASYVDYGYGQVEPNHLSAQRTAQIYAQLPAAADIDVLEQGQFVKYDYAAGVCNFEGKGEWMLVYNEIKLYKDVPGLNGLQHDCEFAMIKDNYDARVYSPFGYALDKDNKPVADEIWDRQARFLNGNGIDAADGSITFADGNVTIKTPDGDLSYPIDDVTAGPDYYEIHYNEDPMKFFGGYKEQMMPAGTKMVPRVFKTNVGDIFTTNTINADELNVGDTLKVGAKGILEAGEDDKMTWQVVKVYTMPDHQKGVKIMRIV